MCVLIVVEAGDRRAVTWLGLLGAISMMSGMVWAEEPRLNSAEQAAGVERPADVPVAAKDIAQRVWSILAAVEQHHIAAPARSELWKIVAPLLCDPGETASLHELLEEFVRCQSADEFSARFRQRWDAMYRPSTALDQLPSATVNALEKAEHLGQFRLMRARDYAVEEQFRGNRYVGLGVNLFGGNDSRPPQFGRVMPGGAAERGGLNDGVTILEIDGRSTRDVPTVALLDLLRGSIGSEVTLKVIPAGSEVEQTVTLTRGLVRIDSVFTTNHHPVSTGRLRFNPAEPIGYLNVSGITGSTLQELRDAEVRLRFDGVRAMVLDFQSSQRSDNFHQARLVADGLLDGGTLWHWHERNMEPRTDAADRECLFRGMPLVVMVDRSTGAAQAAVAAALQDAGRAVIVGQSPTFDGAIPSGVPLADGQQILWLNTARLTRSRVDRTWPLVPDHPINSVPMTQIDVQRQLVVTQPNAGPPQVVAPKHPVVVATPGQHAVRRRFFVPGEGPVSALTPSNLTHHEIVLRMSRAIQLPDASQQLELQQRMINRNNQRTSSMQAAQQIARELLMKLPPSS